MFPQSLFVLASITAVAHAHGQILAAVGVSGTSVGFQGLLINDDSRIEILL